MNSRVAAVVVLAFGSWPSSAMSQTRSLPEFYRDLLLPGFGVDLDYGGNVDTTEGPEGKTVALTGTVGLGHVYDSIPDRGRVAFRRFNASATVGHFSQRGAQGWSIGGAFNFLGLLQAGADYSSSGGTARVHLIPISGSLGFFNCLSSKLNFNTWVGAGWDFQHVSDMAGAGWEPSWGSFSVGARLDLRNGLGFEMAGGGPLKSGGPPSDPYRRGSLAVGLRFTPHNIVKVATPKLYGCHFGL